MNQKDRIEAIKAITELLKLCTLNTPVKDKVLTEGLLKASEKTLKQCISEIGNI